MIFASLASVLYAEENYAYIGDDSLEEFSKIIRPVNFSNSKHVTCGNGTEIVYRRENVALGFVTSRTKKLGS